MKSKLKIFKLVYYYFGLIHFSVKLKYHIIYVIKIKITIVVGDQVLGMFGLDDPWGQKNLVGDDHNDRNNFVDVVVHADENTSGEYRDDAVAPV